MKLKKIAILFIISLISCNNIYAKYTYHFEETMFELSRDTNAPLCTVTYSKEEWTNQNVIITITSNKEIEQVSGFVLSEDKKVLTKEVSENEYGKVQVRDFSGNYTEVEYNVANIDKEPPQIIGCINGETHKAPVVLDYADNGELKDVFVDKYGDTLSIEYKGVYYDTGLALGIDRTKSTLSIKVTENPVNTRKYKYYVDNQLYATTTDKEYTFTGLSEGMTYELKVQAIDAEGNILQEVTQKAISSYYDSIAGTKTNNNFTATLNGLSNEVAQVKYAIWNYHEESNFRWYDAEISDNSAIIDVEAFNSEYYPSYVAHVYLYDEEGQVLDVVGFSIDFVTNYIPTDNKIDINHLTQPGNYQIVASDCAGNETIYYIKVE